MQMSQVAVGTKLSVEQARLDEDWTEPPKPLRESDLIGLMDQVQLHFISIFDPMLSLSLNVSLSYRLSLWQYVGVWHTLCLAKHHILHHG